MSMLAASRPAARAIRDDERTATWLKSPYSAVRWKVCDTYGNDEATIDFEMRMPDGRFLPDHPSLYATVKEYAYWARESASTKIEDAATHNMLVRSLMNVAHVLSLRKVESFSRVTAFDIEQITEACRGGVNALVNGSQRLADFLRQRLDDLSRRTHNGGGIDRGWAISCAGLPASCARSAENIAIFKYCDAYLQSPSASFKPPHLKPTNLTVEAIRRILLPIEHIYNMRFMMLADTLRIRPFAKGASAEAKRIGVNTRRTPTPKPRLALLFISQTMDWVSENGNRIVEASRETSDMDGSVLVRNGAGAMISSTILKATKLLSTACYLLVAAFTARRSGELEKLTRECLTGEPGERWLQCQIVKTHNRVEAIPVPDIVAKAVKLLLSLTDGKSNDRLFRHPSGSGWGRGKSENGIAAKDKPSRRINELANHLGVDRDPVSEEGWRWTSHQFRRFFAIMYLHKAHGSIESLSHHLRHFNLGMTRRYVTSDPEVAAIFMDCEWGYTGELARSIAFGSRVPLSGMDKYLANLAKRLSDNFRKNLQVVTPERVASALALLIRRRGMVVRPTPWSDCFAANTAAAARKAKCRSGDAEGTIGPDLTSAGPNVCPGCRWSAMSAGQARNVREEAQFEIAMADEPSREGTMLARFQKVRLVDVAAVYEKARANIVKAEPQGNEHGT